MKNTILFAWMFVGSIHAHAQFIKGRIVDSEDRTKSIVGAQVYFLGINSVVQSDSIGNFTLSTVQTSFLI